MRAIARNTIERVARAVNYGFDKRVNQYNSIDNNYVNWKLYPLYGLLEHRKVSIGLPYKIHLQREINDDKIFFGENASDANLEITNLQLYIPVITPSIEVETRIFNMLTKDIEIAFLRRNTSVKDGGYLPLIFAGLAAVGATAREAAEISQAIDAKKAADAEKVKIVDKYGNGKDSTSFRSSRYIRDS
ncbi:hypothetical protein LOTGIDRAFT_175035 [Lottia gigantea]|uniref:Uncharacterized protein n=1 Tax=Lottia gigantea TaxID=225164 RepID=V4AGC5_LOTGI|nr:hypothetical protein LOTGIDRAFT_175035 [Lottia gigantea]ESO95927.1 hypothetical protein LOTGIDRAFT_175035 [Lottia gigantea]